MRSSCTPGPAYPSDEGEQTGKRRRGRPRKAEQSVDGSVPGTSDGPAPAVKRSRGRPPRDASTAPQAPPLPHPVRTPSPAGSDSDSGQRRRGRPPRADAHRAAAAGDVGPPGSRLGDAHGGGERSDSGQTAGGRGGRSSGARGHGGDTSQQAAAADTLSSRRGRPRREGTEQQVEEAGAAAAAEGVGTAVARRGRPPLQKASREAELQVMLRRELRLKPTELRPPPARCAGCVVACLLWSDPLEPPS